MARLLCCLAGLLVVALPGCAFEPGRESAGPDRSIPIDMGHILHGRINRDGELVGVHHAPSAPKTMNYEGSDCDLEIKQTSPGGEEDVVTARIYLRDPQTKQIVAEKNSTLFPAAWKESQIEAAIREAYAQAVKNGDIEDNGRWTGRTKSGIRIDGYLSRDNKRIATAFPVYVRKRGGR